jgi:uncharacterized integral membrane protein
VIIFYRPKWLAILLVSFNLVLVTYISAFLNCLKPTEFCNSETYEIGPFILIFIFGLVYGSVILAIVSLIRMLIRRRQ